MLLFNLRQVLVIGLTEISPLGVSPIILESKNANKALSL